MKRSVPQLHLSTAGARVEWVWEFTCDSKTCGASPFRAAATDPVRATDQARSAGFVIGRGRDLCGVCAAAATETHARPNPPGVGVGSPHRVTGVSGAPQQERRSHRPNPEYSGPERRVLDPAQPASAGFAEGPTGRVHFVHTGGRARACASAADARMIAMLHNLAYGHIHARAGRRVA